MLTPSIYLRLQHTTYMKENIFQLLSEFRKPFTSVQLIKELSIFIASPAKIIKLCGLCPMKQNWIQQAQRLTLHLIIYKIHFNQSENKFSKI